jgi:endoglucanase
VAVILEPDALAHGECADDRFDTLAYAVTALKKQAGARVYIDAGHAGWVDAGTMAGRLKSANIAAADGFSLNVSSFQTNADSISYGSSISSQVGGKSFVIDTSRNGKGPSGGAWCNPPGRGLGSKPGSDTGNPLVHAFLWVKRPGESDGSSAECNGGPGAGQWFQSYAIELCKNAAF